MRTLRQAFVATTFVAAVYLILAYAFGWPPFRGYDKIIIVRDGSVDIDPFDADDKKPKEKETYDGKYGYSWKVKAKYLLWFEGPQSDPCPATATPTRIFSNFTTASIDVRQAASPDVQTIEILATSGNKLFLTFPDALTLSYDAGKARHTVNNNGNTLFRIASLTVDTATVSPTSGRYACVAFTK